VINFTFYIKTIHRNSSRCFVNPREKPPRKTS